MTDFRHGLALAILVLLAATALPSAARSQTAASPAEAATKLVAALAKGDITGASVYAAAADRDRFVSLMQASDTLAKARDRFQQTVKTKLPESEAGTTLVARSSPARIDHINIVAQRNVSSSVAELDVKGFGTDGKSTPTPSTWQAVQENGQWRIHLPPCATAAAAEPMIKRTQAMIAATDAVTASIDNKQIASFADAHIALVKAERGVLRATGVRQ
jgi:hypothetical protein